MRTLNYYIKEAFKVTADTKINVKNYHPKTRDELKELVEKLIKERGDDADLNDIDTSKITDMNGMFHKSKFNGDISGWDVSKVKNMNSMFYHSEFNGDISNWDVSKVEDMSYMFEYSKFNGDISDWDVSNIEYTTHMFKNCPLENQPKKQPKFHGVNMSNCIFPGRSRLPQIDISKWDASKVRNMSDLFKV